jgi:hypothetical protein
MNFNRNAKELTADDKQRLDCRMIAFKHHLMNCRVLYWDIVNSRKIESEQRSNIQNALIEYLNTLYQIHPESTMDFLITGCTKKYKEAVYKGEYYCLLGDAAIISLSPNAYVEQIINELSERVLKGNLARTAIGYYISNNDFYTPDHDFYLLELEYFKKQMILGKINDTMPSDEQIETYCSRNKKHIKCLEYINRNDL